MRLVDMNLSPRWVRILSEAGFEAVHWSAIGAHDATDAAIMAHAAEHGQIGLTHDLDFGAMLAASPRKGPSVVQLRAGNVSPEAIGPQVIAALNQMRTELQLGALVTVDPLRTRLRVLPLRSA